MEEFKLPVIPYYQPIGNRLFPHVVFHYILQVLFYQLHLPVEAGMIFFNNYVFSKKLLLTMAVPHGVTPTDYLFTEQWDHQLINTPDAWEKLQNDPQAATKGNTAFGNPNVIIAICDNGVDVSHPDLNVTLSNGAPKIAATLDAETGNPVAEPQSEHGTACASAAASMANTATGIAGVAGNSAIMAIVLPGSEELLADMFEWVAGIDPGNSQFPSAPVPGAAIISNSYYGYRLLPVLSDAIKRITFYGRGGKGIILFGGTGNEDNFFDHSNAFIFHPHAMAVAASTLNGNNEEVRAPYSNFGAGIAFCAPSCDLQPIAIHNPPLHRGTFTATHSVLATQPIARTTIKAGSLPPDAPPNSVLVNVLGNIGEKNEVVIGQLDHVNTERYRVINDNATHNYIVLDHAPRVAIKENDEVLRVFGNCPGHNLSNDTLKAGVSSGNRIMVNNPALYSGGQAIILNPHTVFAEAHAVQGVNPATGEVTLMTDLKKPFGAGTPVVIGNADYTDSFGGTSYATPVCAGIAALCLAANKNLSWVEVRDIMRNTAIKINPGEKGRTIDNVRVGQWRTANYAEIVSKDGIFNYLDPLVNTLIISKNADKVVTVTSVAGFEPGQAIEIKEDPSDELKELRVITGIKGSTLILDVPLDPSLTYQNYTISAGGKPHYSAFYGYGRVDAARAVQAALDAATNYRQLVIRNNLSDTGTAASTDIQSPDIWVTDKPMEADPARNVYTEKKNVNGKDDFLSGRDYTGNQNAKFYIEIDGNNGVADTFLWKLNDIGGNDRKGVSITTDPQKLSDDFQILFFSATGHRIGDNWTVYIDRTEKPIEYAKDAPHTNPNIEKERFIHARIKNIVTGNLAQQYKNLDCLVRFYIVLSDGKTANAINQGGQGFDSNFFFSGNGKNNDWDDRKPISEIQSGEAGTYFLGEVEIPEGQIEPNDPADAGIGTCLVSVPWKKEDIPPVDLEHSIFLLVHIAPFHGPLNGNGAHNNSCLSYREVTFARFFFKENAGTSDLRKQLEIDAFGAVLIHDFIVDVQSDAGTFITEKLKLEMVRVNENGTEEKAVFHYDGTNWTFDPAHPQWTGLQISPPIIFTDGEPATGNQTKISFEGQFPASKENKQIILRPQITSKHSTVIIATGEHVVEIIEQGEMPIGIDEDALTAPPPPKSHAFADMANVQQSVAQAFGPVTGQESNEFRVTSLFTTTTDTNAYAITDGFVFLQPGPDPNTVNLVLRPFKQPVVGFTPVK
jgi:subtilisin family serine protease